MKPEEITIRIYTYSDPDELPADSQRLIELAREATQKAWAPYSQFKVGAALLLENGEIITGNNQENSAYPSGLCAERVALFSTVAHGGRPTALALVAPRTQKDMTWPCGACLQVALELGGPGMAVYVSGTDDDSPIEESTVGELLPRGPYIDR